MGGVFAMYQSTPFQPGKYRITYLGYYVGTYQSDRSAYLTVFGKAERPADTKSNLK